MLGWSWSTYNECRMCKRIKFGWYLVYFNVVMSYHNTTSRRENCLNLHKTHIQHMRREKFIIFPRQSQISPYHSHELSLVAFPRHFEDEEISYVDNFEKLHVKIFQTIFAFKQAKRGKLKEIWENLQSVHLCWEERNKSFYSGYFNAFTSRSHFTCVYICSCRQKFHFSNKWDFYYFFITKESKWKNWRSKIKYFEKRSKNVFSFFFFFKSN